MSPFLFMLNGVDISVTEPNSFNMQSLTSCGGRDCYTLLPGQIDNKQKGRNKIMGKTNLCSLLQKMVSL